jgi:perosamine synthetase
MIQVNEPLLNGNENKYLKQAIDTGWISSEGPFVKQLEDGLGKIVGRKHAIAVSNGSVALDTAIEILGITKGDEVIMPTFTIISCVAPIVRAGAKPVLIDVDPITWNMDVKSIEAKITPKTKAIMVVHIYGLPVDMDPVLALAKKYNLKVIEDAAEVIGQTYKGRQCGSLGDVSTFSFYPNKHITTGEGGMILTDNDTLAQKARELRNLCFIPPRRFIHEDLGWNFRMTNLQAAVGVAQMERLDEFVDIKRKVGNLYNELLGDLADKLVLPLQKTNYAENIYWVYGMVLKNNVPFDALEAMSRLAKEGVACRPFFYPMHLQPVLRKKRWFKGEQYPNATVFAERGFYVPSGLALTEKDIHTVSEKLHKILDF